MTLTCWLLFTVVLCVNVHRILSCGGGSSSCSWKTCQATYSAYTPNPSQGGCVYQRSVVSHHYQSHSKNSGCPGDSPCTGSDRTRVLCSCKRASGCWWKNWGSWGGHISQGTCGTQYRYRQAGFNIDYVHQVSNCHAIKSTCAQTTDTQQRRWCNCRQATSCAAGQWTSWNPPPGNGQCVKQTRHHDKIPTYVYKQQQNNCGGIVGSCPGRIVENREFCSCAYKECVQGAWTSWEMHTWVGNCPRQRRLMHYREITKYQSAHQTCNNVGRQSCPPPINDIRQKEITCPKLPVPANGMHLDVACNGANSKCKATCGMKCNTGYIVQGSRLLTCLGTGKWDNSQGTCKDNTPPTITCPNIGHYNTDPNENHAMIDLLTATVSDNSGMPVKITTSHKFPLKVMAKSRIAVTYTATDQAGNTKTCTVHFEVKDIEAPKVQSCPKDQFISTGSFPHVVNWNDAEFHDNVDGDNTDVFPSIFSGSHFYMGKHTVTYTGVDKSFNKATCTFTVELERSKCPMSDPPKYGSAQCNIKKNGIHEAFVCSASCKQGYWFLEGLDIPKLYNFYVCALEGQWSGQDAFPMGQMHQLTTGKAMWPDCAVGMPPDGVILDFHIFGGSCKDEQQIQKIKADFLKAIVSDMIVNAMFCSNPQYQNCVVENIRVYCASRKRRSVGSTRRTVIKFSYAIRDKSLAGKSLLDRNKLSSMSKALNTEKAMLLKKIQSIAPKVLKDYTTTAVTAQSVLIACEPGYEYKVITGKGDINSRTKCLKCPRGTYYVEATKKCGVCQPGSYQDEEGKLSCKQCPAGKTTIGKLTRDYHECKAICQPGTYSSNGLEICIACPVATYQPMSKSTSCIKCPSTKATTVVGSTRVSDCKENSIDYRIHSEGCGDPGKTPKTCGYSTIQVNGKDYSRHGRGINLVVVDAKSGKVLSSASFDWHGDPNACYKTYHWIAALKDDVVVLAAYQDEASRLYDNLYCRMSLLMIRGKEPFQRVYRASFALAGYKGKRNNGIDWIHQKQSPYGRGPTDVNGSITLLR